jgi:hypothetical protein
MDKELKRRGTNAVRAANAGNSVPEVRLEFDRAWLQPTAKLSDHQIGDYKTWLRRNLELDLIPQRERRRAKQLLHTIRVECWGRQKAKKKAERRERVRAAMHAALIRDLDETFVAVAMGQPAEALPADSGRAS